MRPGKKFLAAFLTLALCLSLLCSVPVGAARICFTAIDESVLKLTNENMPIWSAGVLYAPYTTFNEGDNGVANWSIQTSYSKTSGRITLFDTRRFLSFDLNTGTCWDDLSGVAYSGGAIVRGGRPYLPVAIVCKHFGLTYSYNEIEQGSLLRIKTDKAVISDSRFSDAASNVLELRLREYRGVSTPAPTPTPTPTPEPQLPSTPEPPENEQDVDTYLAFRCDSGELLESILTVMDGMREKGMFFLAPDVVMTRGDLVMQVLGSGHSVGVLAQAESAEETRRLLNQGSRALSEQAFYRPTVALVAEEFQSGMEQLGWVCWDSTLDLEPGSSSGPNYFAGRTINRLGNRTRDTYLTLPDGADTLRVLPTLLRRLEDEGFELDLPLETRI